MQMLKESEIRMRAVEAAAAVASDDDDIGNLLVHADWIASYVSSGRPPEVETESSITGSGVVAA